MISHFIRGPFDQVHHVPVILIQGTASRNLPIEILMSECQSPVDEVAQNIGQLIIIAALKLRPGKIRVFSFWSVHCQRIP